MTTRTIFPETKHCARANQVILVVKCDSHHHSPMSSSENVVVVKTSYQNLMLGNGNKSTNFCGEKSTMLLSKVSMFREEARKLKIEMSSS